MAEEAVAVEEITLERLAASTFADMRENFDLPGVGWLIQHRGEIYTGAVGSRARDTPDNLVSESDPWHLGSCSKAITSTVLAILFEDPSVPQLDWDATLGSLLPQEKMLHPGLAAVTLEMLMQHRSGILTDLPPEEEKGIVASHPDDPRAQRQVLLETVLARAPEHPPDSKYHYSNVGYAILSAIAERTLGQSWEDIVTARLKTPLGMDSLRFGGPRGLDEPRGHNEAGEPEDHADANFHHASFAMSCSLPDYLKFARVHLQALRGAAAPEAPVLPLSPAAFARLYKTASIEGYGEGEGYCAGAWRTIWSIDTHVPDAPTNLIFHWGTNFFYHAGVLISAQHDLVAVACTNACNDMMARFASHMAFQAICDHIDAKRL